MNKRRFIYGIGAFVISFGLMYAISGVVSILGAGMIWQITLPELVFLCVPLIFSRMNKENFFDRCSVSVPTAGVFLSSVLIMLGVSALQSAVIYAYYGIFGETSATDSRFFNLIFDSGVEPYLVMVGVAVIPAICEEVLFRGYILNSFKTKKGMLSAVFLSSLLFSAMHLDLYKAAPVFIFALGLGYIAVKTGSVLIPVIFHFINNAMSLIGYYRYYIGDTSDSSESISIILSQKSYLWLGLSALAVGLLVCFFGYKAINKKKHRVLINVMAIVCAVIVFFIGVGGFVNNEMEDIHYYELAETINGEYTYEDSFTVNKNTLGYFYAGVFCSSDIEYSVVMTDSEGNTVYDSDKAESFPIIMDAGEYTVSYYFTTDDYSEKSYVVYANARLLGFAEYE